MYVDVPGGRLAVEEYPGTGEPVLAVHGISSQRKLWLWLHAQNPQQTLLAPDLRGRGESVALPGPGGLDRHTDDLVAVLDAARLRSVHVCGMSMGAFVAVRMAARHPDRVRSLILLDGGLPVPPPPGLTPESVGAAFADRLSRLDRTWPDVAGYAAHFTSTTGTLLDRSDPLLLAYLAHDLDRAGRVRLDPDALVTDAADVYFSRHPVEELTVPVRLTWAQWGAGQDGPPMYSRDTVQHWRSRLTTLVADQRLPGLDHSGAIMGAAGAAAAAAMIADAVGADQGVGR